MKWNHLLTLARVPNVPTVWSNILMAWALSGGGCLGRLAAALAGGTLLYAGGCTLNDAFDARWDRAHKPDRLIPSGVLTERAVWTLGGLEMGAGLLLFILAPTVGLVLALGPGIGHSGLRLPAQGIAVECGGDGGPAVPCWCCQAQRWRAGD